MHIITRISLAALCCFAIVSCEKKKDPDPVPAGKVVTIDDIVGSYTGRHYTHKIDYAYAPASGKTYYRDTVYTTTDTLTINKLSADSFMLMNSEWAVYNKPLRFAFSKDNRYFMEDPRAFGAKDTILIRFNTDTDSMLIERFESMNGSSGYHMYTNTFSGIK